MANVSAADVKRLREATGAGMMDSKKALEEAEGDFDKAVELLRIKGAKSLGKRAERTAANGLVASADGALIELNCETDFVAKNDQFQQLGRRRSPLWRQPPSHASSEELAAATLADGQTVQQAIDALATVIGEKLVLGRVAVFDGPDHGLPSQACQRPSAVGGRPGGFHRRRRRRCPWRGHAGGSHASAVPQPRRDPGRRRRERATYRRGDRSRGGQARGRAAQDHRGSGDRVLQAGRAARPAQRAGPEEDRRSRCLPTPASP